MRWTAAAGLGGVALTAGAAAAIALAPEPAPVPAPAPLHTASGTSAWPGDEPVVTPMTPIALGHRRAIEYLFGDPARKPLFDAASRASPSVVRVVARRVAGGTTRTSRGSGVVVGERRVLTARHLLFGDGEGLEIRVMLASGEEVAAKVVAKGEEGTAFQHAGDWLVLEVQSDSPQLPPPLRTAAATAGAEVVAVGFGGDAGLAADGCAVENTDGPSGSPTWSVGRVVDPAEMTLEPLAGSVPVGGVSGGAVVDATGGVVGIVVAVSWTTVSAVGVPKVRRYTMNVAPVVAAASRLTASSGRSR